MTSKEHTYTNVTNAAMNTLTIPQVGGKVLINSAYGNSIIDCLDFYDFYELFNTPSKMHYITRPSWLSLEEERAIRVNLSSSLLEGVKSLHKLRMAKGISNDEWGLKESKAYCEQLVPLAGTPAEVLKEAVEQVENLEKMLNESLANMRGFLKDALPGITEEKIEKALEDREYLKKISTTLTTSEKFGI